MFFIEQEIGTQPQVWLQAAALAPQVHSLLPQAGERVAFTGCGTSWFMSVAAAALCESEGLAEADAFTASEFNHARRYDRVLAISRSGTTTEVVDLLGRLKGVVPTTVITAVPDSPVTQAADHAVIIEFADERSVVQTRSATTVLALLRAHLGHDIAAVARDAQAALDLEVGALADAEQIAFLGSGWGYGLAQEAALKTREAAQFWAEAYPPMDYRHGPMSIAQPGRVTWCFGVPPAGLAEEVRATGAGWESSSLDPMAHLVFAQRVAVAIAKRRGLNPDQPRGLSRSIILG